MIFFLLNFRGSRNWNTGSWLIIIIIIIIIISCGHTAPPRFDFTPMWHHVCCRLSCGLHHNPVDIISKPVWGFSSNWLIGYLLNMEQWHIFRPLVFLNLIPWTSLATFLSAILAIKFLRFLVTILKAGFFPSGFRLQSSASMPFYWRVPFLPTNETDGHSMLLA